MNDQTDMKQGVATRPGGDTQEGASTGIRIECLWQGPATLGECPLWDHRTDSLFWIDSLGKKIWHHSPQTGKTIHTELEQVVGSIGLRSKGGLIAGLENGFHFVDPDNGKTHFIADPEADIAGTRLNDGKCDRAGRFWCGSMNVNFEKPNASLYRLDPDLSLHRMETGFMVSNGIAWSVDDSLLYFSDSRPDRSYAYDYDIQKGDISHQRKFVKTDAYEGRIDGATVDCDRNYWGALFEGSAVACFSPDGEMLRKIALPVSCPTMCSFGGPDFDILYVTSATFTLNEAELKAQPLAGALFAITGLGVRGLPEPEFGG